MALGQILKEARIRRGFTESEVAERIKMNTQMIVDIEAENYSRIAAPIYGKGYVRKYAEFLGIDYRPLVEEFKNTFGTGTVEKPAVPLESFDPESGMLTKMVPNQAPRPSNDIQQPTVTSSVQPAATPAQVVGQAPSAESVPIQAEQPTSLFSEFEPVESMVEKQQVAATPEAPKHEEEIFVPAHLATTPPKATIPPPNTVPDSVAQSRYTFSPEKFTPRTTVFKPEQLPSATAPEPVALSVAPFSYPESVIISNENEEEEAPPLVLENDTEESTLFSSKQNRPKGPILSKYSGQTRSIEPDPIEDTPSTKTKNEVFANISSKLINIFRKTSEFFKDIFSFKAEEDLTKALARKQRRLGFGIVVVIVVILIAIFMSGGSSTDSEKAEQTEEQNVESTSEELPNLVEADYTEPTQESSTNLPQPNTIEDADEDLTVDTSKPVEPVQILPLPKGFVD